MLLFFDISENVPRLVHSMRMVLPSSVGTNWIKQIETDLDKNILLLRMKSSSVLVV